MLTFSTSAMLKLVKCHKTNPLCHKALRKHKTFVDTRLHTCFTSCDLNASSEWLTPPALSYLRKVKWESDLAQLGYSPREQSAAPAWLRDNMEKKSCNISVNWLVGSLE